MDLAEHYRAEFDKIVQEAMQSMDREFTDTNVPDELKVQFKHILTQVLFDMYRKGNLDNIRTFKAITQQMEDEWR